MNPTQLKSLADAINAHLRVEPVERRTIRGFAGGIDPEWIEVPKPDFNTANNEWRPKPREPRKVYMVESDVVRPFFTLRRPEANTVANQACPKREVIEFVEVLPP